MPLPPKSHVNAEARGKLRVWKKRLARRCAIIDAARKRDTFLEAGNALAHRSSERGRLRALAKLCRALGPGAKLVSRPGDPLALWVYLRPRDSVMKTDGEVPALEQPCVTVNYLLIGMLRKRGRIADGLWTIEATDHALARLLQRARNADPEKVLLEAHHAILQTRIDDIGAAIRRNGGGDSFLLAAGPGAFICTPVLAPDVSAKKTTLYIRMPTWVEQDMMYDHQKPVAFTTDQDASLGGTYLRPLPLQSAKHQRKMAVVADVAKLLRSN